MSESGADQRRRGAARRAGIAIAVVVVVIVIAAVILVAFYHESTLDITVSHACCISTIYAVVSVNGKVIATVDIAPGYQWSDGYQFDWFGGYCEIVSVVADGSGGTFGPSSDQATPTVCSGQSVAVSLSV